MSISTMNAWYLAQGAPRPPARLPPRRPTRTSRLALVTWAVACLALVASSASMLYFARDARHARATLGRVLASGSEAAGTARAGSVDELARLQKENQALRERLSAASSLRPGAGPR